MSTSNQKTIDPNQDTTGLAIFDDVREVRAEPAASVGFQLLVVVVSGSIVLGIVAVAAIVAVLAVTAYWPYLLAFVAPWLVELVTSGG